MVIILWHRRETRRLTENTNLDLYHREAPAYSTEQLKQRIAQLLKIDFVSTPRERRERYFFSKRRTDFVRFLFNTDHFLVLTFFHIPRLYAPRETN